MMNISKDDSKQSAKALKLVVEKLYDLWNLKPGRKKVSIWKINIILHVQSQVDCLVLFQDKHLPP